jgi:hypothetical protein
MATAATNAIVVPRETQSIIDELVSRLAPCPRCGTTQILAQVLIQKKDWGGKVEPANLAHLCMPCDEDWRKFAKEKGTKDSPGEYKTLFGEFLISKPGPEDAEARIMATLSELARLRIDVALETQRLSGRLRSRARRIETVLPLEESSLAKIAREVFPDPEDQTWEKLLISELAPSKRLLLRVETNIAELVRNFPIWTEYLEHIPGIGAWLAGFLIAAIRDPRRFRDTAKLFGNAGLRVEDGVAQAKSRGGKLDYDPRLKIVIVQLVPMSLRYQKTRFPESPYSELFDRIKLHEEQKARGANPTHCYIRGCEETDIINLGEKDDVFAGYCCKKTLRSKKPHKFLNPAHRERRVLRAVGKKFFSDFYHTWLFLVGENPDVARNPRIMWVFEQARKSRG